MRFIPTKVHGILDYVVGLLLIFAPSLFNFQTGGIEARLPVILGVAALVYSLLTRYELGLIKVLPFKVHLTIDFLSGALLLLSPWLFGFAEIVWVPHVVVGLLEIGAALMTVPTPAHDVRSVPVTR